MLLKLLLLFTVVPLVELFLLLQLGQLLGPWQTLAIVLVTGTMGAWLAKREGLGVLRSLTDELKQGIPPATRLAEGVLVLMGGMLLITPGVLTDLAGFALIVPFSRRLIAPALLSSLAARLDMKVQLGPDAARASSAPPRGAPKGSVHTGQEPTPFSNPFDDLP